MTQETGQISEEQDPMRLAQGRLAKACMDMPMDPMRAAISTYVNNALQSSRVDALEELAIHGPMDGMTAAESYPILIVKHMTMRAEQLERQSAELKQRIQLARPDAIGRPGRRN
ncbi:MAG TPA: hypothetical protein VGG49_02465 [Steroidobacteraceae bacterium]|jgi:hypothetical protein